MRRLLLPVMVATLMWAVGCGGGSSSTTTTTVSVIISPAAPAAITQGQMVTFTATVNSTDSTTGTVTDITSTGVTWQVDGTTGGSSAIGTITTAGVFTAPGTVNIPTDATITALSVQDSSKGASASLEIDPLPQISIAPATATVAAGQSQTFTPTYASGVTPAADWYVNNIAGGNPTFGMVSPQGVYTAPQVPPSPGGQVVVTAELHSDHTQISTATITDTYAAASLKCSYAFLLRGENRLGRFVRVGSLTADGAGGVTGVEDINGGGVTATAVTFTGTYTAAADGRGTMVFHDGYGSHFGGSDSTFTVALVSANQVQMAEADTFATGSGEADLQSSCPATAPTAMSGQYVFDFSGTGASAAPLSIVGVFAAALNGAATPGGIDDGNDNGTLSQSSPVTFSYALGSTGGRGTATLIDNGATRQLGFYMISATQLRFIELDSTQAVAGDAVAQAAMTFGAADLGGNCLLTTDGFSSSGFVTTAAILSADNLGHFLTGSLTQNNAGTVAIGTAVSGTYAVSANGRGTATLSGGRTYVFYLMSEDSGVFQETDSSAVSDGTLTSFFNPAPSLDSYLQSLTGNFALQWTGSGTSLGEQDATGQFVTVGGQFKSGTLDRNTANGTNPSLGFAPSASTSLTPTTSYSFATAPGTVTITVGTTNLQFAVFFTSQTSAVLIRVDTSDVRALSGVFGRQF